MPLSEGQISALKNGATSISIQTENPKKAGSKAWERFEKYKHATTIAEAMGNSANWQDLSGDFEKGYMKIVDAGDETMTSSAKRSAPEGTPDRKHTPVQSSSLRNWFLKFWCLRFGSDQQG